MRPRLAVAAGTAAVLALAATAPAHARRINPDHAAATAAAKRPAAARPPAAPAEQARRSNQLGFDLYARLRARPGGVAFSPVSIQLAFGMLHVGARGGAAAAIERVIHLAPGAGADADLGALSQALQLDTSVTRTLFANSLWLASDLSLSPAMQRRVTAGFSPRIDRVRFHGESERARVRINYWVRAATDGMISSLLPPGAVDDSTALVMVNALVFTGNWTDAFAPALTRHGTFTTAAGKVTEVPMMHRQGPARFAEVGPARVVELPYGDGRLAMDLIQPIRGDLAGLEASLTEPTVARWLAALRPETRVNLTIPRMSLNASLSLRDALSAMGLGSLFDGTADLSGLLATPTALAVSDVLHSVAVKVDEAGTRAAAATAVVMTRAMKVGTAFTADRPFLFLIRETRTGAILFMGRVADPRA